MEKKEERVMLKRIIKWFNRLTFSRKSMRGEQLNMNTHLMWFKLVFIYFLNRTLPGTVKKSKSL